jgi:hypothetical protein
MSLLFFRDISVMDLEISEIIWIGKGRATEKKLKI